MVQSDVVGVAPRLSVKVSLSLLCLESDVAPATGVTESTPFISSTTTWYLLISWLPASTVTCMLLGGEPSV